MVNLFNSIDSSAKAYLMGLFANRGSFDNFPRFISVSVSNSAAEKFTEFNILKSKSSEKEKTIIICNQTECETIVERLFANQYMYRGNEIDLLTGETFRQPMMFADAGADAYAWSFIRGFCEGRTKLLYTDDHIPICRIESNSIFMLNCIADYSKIPSNLINGIDFYTLEFRDTNAIDFMGFIHDSIADSPYNIEEVDIYKQWLQGDVLKQLSVCKVYKSHPHAIFPTKAKASDVGYDLSIICSVKYLGSNTVLYNTGLRLRIPYGYYAEIVPRSSLSKSGYMLANSIGIIDPSYTGELLIALTKVSPDAAHFEMPFRCCQLIFKKQEHVELLDSSGDGNIERTARGSGGFGSSGGAASI